MSAAASAEGLELDFSVPKEMITALRPPERKLTKNQKDRERKKAAKRLEKEKAAAEAQAAERARQQAEKKTANLKRNCKARQLRNGPTADQVRANIQAHADKMGATKDQRKMMFDYMARPAAVRLTVQNTIDARL